MRGRSSYSQFRGAGEREYNESQFSGAGRNWSAQQSHGAGRREYRESQFSGAGGREYRESQFSGAGGREYRESQFSGAGGRGYGESQFSGAGGRGYSESQSSGASRNWNSQQSYEAGRREYRESQFSGAGGREYRESQFSEAGGRGFGESQFSGAGGRGYSESQFSGASRNWNAQQSHGAGRREYRELQFSGAGMDRNAQQFRGGGGRGRSESQISGDGMNRNVQQFRGDSGRGQSGSQLSRPGRSRGAPHFRGAGASKSAPQLHDTNKRQRSESPDSDSSEKDDGSLPCRKDRVEIFIEGYRKRKKPIRMNIFQNTNTIGDMRMIMRRIKSVPTKAFTFQGKELEDEKKTAHEYGITAGATLNITVGGPQVGWIPSGIPGKEPKIKIYINMLNYPIGLNQAAKFDVRKFRPNEIVRLLKLIIQHKRRVPADYQRLFFNEIELDDDFKTVGSYGLTKDCNVDLLLGPECGPFMEDGPPIPKKQKPWGAPN